MDRMKLAEGVLCVALLAALVGCNRDTAAPSPAVSPAPSPPAAIPEPTQPEVGIPEAIIVSTNEPFWQARVEGGQVVLIGAGADERRYDIEASTIVSGERVVRASGTAGAVGLRVSAASCQDSMSGALFPFSATLAIDGGEPIPGCARAAIPAQFHGRWAPDAAACADPDSTIEDIEIDGRALHFHESVGFPALVEVMDGDSVRLTSSYTGEGEHWSLVQTLALSGDTLVLTGPDDVRLERVRCP